MTPRKNDNTHFIGKPVPRGTLPSVREDVHTHSSMFRSVSMSMPPLPLLPDQIVAESPRAKSDNSKTLRKCNSSPISIHPKDASTDQSNFGLPSHWVWQLRMVPAVPMYHPLESNVLRIVHIPLDTITERISTFMRLHSITCSYHDEAARVDCLTEQLCKFVVQLWQGKDQVNEILVEVQRRHGCCIELQAIRRQLHHAIMTGESSPPQQMDGRSIRIMIEKVEEIMENNTTQRSGQGHESNSQTGVFPDALEICHDLLDSERYDQKLLGMESLCILTDPSKVSKQAADRAARVLIYGDADDSLSIHRLLEQYFVDIELTNHERADYYDSDDEDDDGEPRGLGYSQGSYFGAMHLLALRTLANSLESISYQKENKSALAPLDLSSPFWRTVTTALVYDLEVASHRPIEATLSAKCLRLLKSLEPKVLSITCGRTHLLPFLENAHQFGKDHHLGLERESKRLMQRMGYAF